MLDRKIGKFAVTDQSEPYPLGATGESGHICEDHGNDRWLKKQYSFDRLKDHCVVIAFCVGKGSCGDNGEHDRVNINSTTNK